mmetsp:Transcript_67044/g.218281  ORF Transcript_67044/g.218281 Transcript_67044/m.218281 type:complete len:319 (+) Transcript_67044:380-1336(+)
MLVADCGNNRIRRIDVDGVVTTLAGSGQAGFSDGPGETASFHSPVSVAVDGAGNCVVADFRNNCVRKVGVDGYVVTLAADAEQANCAPTAIMFDHPAGVAVDGDGNVVVAETSRHRIRLVTAGLMPCHRVSMAGAAPLRSSSFVEDMRRMMVDPSLADITFVVNGEAITAHRNVLAARSEYFAAMLTSHFQEASAGARVAVSDGTAEAFRMVLGYLYTDSIDLADGDALEVLRLADKYNLVRLYQMSTRHCLRKLDGENAVERLVQSDLYGLQDLRGAALTFVIRHFAEIRSANPRSLDRLVDRPGLMLEVMLQLPVV